jgi:hypothetical protein
MAALFETLRGMKPGVEKYFFAAAAAVFFLAAAGARAQPLPLEALGAATNFSSVTYFEPPHEQQVKARLSSAEASPLPGAVFDLKQMKVENFNAAGKLEVEVQAPQCTYAMLDHVASSPGHLEVKSGDGKYRDEGDGFLWQENEQTLVISNHVHTVIKTEILKFSAP